MPPAFFAGQVRLLHKRSKTLHNHLRDLKHLPAELTNYINWVDGHLRTITLALEALLNDPDFCADALLLNQFNDYKRLSELLAAFEYGSLALLDHFNDRDLHFYRFSKVFCKQIGWTAQAPLVSTHSNEYFYSLPYLNLISLPLCEDKHLLALPDFAHELGHIFWIKIYRNFLKQFSPKLKQYISKQKTLAATQSQSATYQNYFSILEDLWNERYVIEFFCDMLAVWLTGAAFGWSHLRLVLSSKSELFQPGFGKMGTHPSDEARMRGILIMLEKMKEGNAAATISGKWEDFKKILPDHPDNEYSFCYPDELLDQVAFQVIALCKQHGLKSFQDQQNEKSNISSILNEAWQIFHQAPSNYIDWEEVRVQVLKVDLAH